MPLTNVLNMCSKVLSLKLSRYFWISIAHNCFCIAYDHSNLQKVYHFKHTLYLNLGLNILNRVAGLNLEGDCLAREGLHENLHLIVDLKKKSQRIT